jgi:hypothetical protein
VATAINQTAKHCVETEFLMRFVPFLFGVALVGGSLALAHPAQAIQIGFSNITNNSPTNAALGERILGLDVSAVGSTQVAFMFTNASSNPLSPVITQLYFDPICRSLFTTDPAGSGDHR